MMETEEIQLTDSQKKVNALFELEQINPGDLAHLTKDECRYLEVTATQVLHLLKDEKRDVFIARIENILQPATKNRFWEHNHQLINGAISKLIRQRGFMPGASDIADETGLSRQTVTKHLKEYKSRPEFHTEMEQFRFMSPRIMAKMFNLATGGDVRAARLYFETVGAVNKRQGDTVVNEQNNYIQINKHHPEPGKPETVNGRATQPDRKYYHPGAAGRAKNRVN